MQLFDWFGKKITKAKFTSIDNDIFETTTKLQFKAIAINIAVSYISNTISKCCFKVYKNEKSIRDELYYALNISPNGNIDANNFKSKIISCLFDNGECLIIQNKNDFFIADSFNHEEKGIEKDYFTDVKIGDKTFNKKFKMEDVFYFKLANSDIKRLLNEMLEEYETIAEYAADSYKNSNVEKYTLDLDQIELGDEEFEKEYNESLKEQLKEFINNPRGVFPQFRGTKLNKLTNTTTSCNTSDIRELRKEMFEIVAQTFKIPVSMLYGNITNIKDIISSFITFTIDPIADMISIELTRKTTSFEEYKKGNHIKVDTSCINHIDLFDIADKAEKLIQNGLFQPDKLLEKMGEEPTGEEHGKKFYITKNLSTPEEMLKNTKEGG